MFDKRFHLKQNRKKKRHTDEADTLLCEGVHLSRDFLSQGEATLWTLLLKGILVYLITAGCIGSYLTAVESEFYALAVHIGILLISIGISLLYYNNRVENIGYFIVIGITVLLAYELRTYINSGFYAVVNDTIDKASEFFSLEEIRSYGEQIQDRRLTITSAMLFLGTAASIILNQAFARKMRYFLSACIVLPILFISWYMNLSPSPWYLFMLLSGLILSYLWKGAGHYEKTDTAQDFVMENKQIRYIHKTKSVIMFFAEILFVFAIIFFGFQLFLPIKTYQEKQLNSMWKQSTKDTAENFVTLGIWGLLNFYPNNGGIESGRLGGVSSVHLDFQTDLIVHFTPYSYDSVYLKTFTGTDYIPYENRWSRNAQVILTESSSQYEAEARKTAFEAGGKQTARGLMKVDNIAAAIGYYLPYYSLDFDKTIQAGSSASYEYYPWLSSAPIAVKESMDVTPWLTVPVQNQADIAQFCRQAGFGGTKEEIIRQVVQYFQDNIPYTLHPGATPYSQDFINYFLTHNKKGYCTHFASAAALIFRYYGIPARYVEGYAISYSDMLNGDLIENADYSDYYSGYSELGTTGLIEVEASDANAHAWVEVYDNDYGWQVVEVTPSSSGEEETESFFDRFMRMFQSDPSEKENPSSNSQGAIFSNENKRLAGIILISILAASITALCLYLLRFQISYQWKFHRAKSSEKLILFYQHAMKKQKRAENELENHLNYREQIAYLSEKQNWEMTLQERESLIRILQKAGFSNESLTKEEWETAFHLLKKYM